MSRTCILILLFSCKAIVSQSQDSSIIYKNQTFTLTEVVVKKNLNTAAFIDYVKNDTTFYKAFRNLHILNWSALNDIRMLNRKGNTKASLHSKTRQSYTAGCRTMQTEEETVTGDFYDRRHQYNYTTADLYASLFFTKGKVCGENNIVAGRSFGGKGLSGMEKHKEQLKQLFFNPGRKITGIPFISNKVALFDNEVAALYNFTIDIKEYYGQTCYVFDIVPKKDNLGSHKGDVVIDRMTTWFNPGNFEIIARNYDLSYSAGVYKFNVSMQVQLGKVNNLLVPTLLRYNGTWGVLFKSTERAQFTATLFNFSL